MFTRLIKCRWSYMILAAIASIALAALTSVFSSRPDPEPQNRADHESEQVSTGKLTKYNESSLRFIN